MAKLVLLPGAWHGPWCFDEVTPLLRAAGHEVVAVDLPETARELADWVALVLAAIGTTPSVLVGHSRSGVVMSAVAEAAPDLAARLIYLAAFVPADGQSLMSIATANGAQMELAVDQAGRTCTLAEPDVAGLFYQDCSDAVAAASMAKLRPEPLFSITTPVRLSAGRFGAVPRDYIECSADRAISLAAQRRMQAVWPMQRVRTLPTGHSPFLSAPEALAGVIVELAG